MTKFFLASSLILIISLIIILYYWSKQKIKIRKDKKLNLLIHKKYHIDEKEYLRNYISHHIPLLIENDVQWISIWSKLDPRYKTELTYNPILSLIQIGAGNIPSIQQYQKDLTDLGVNTVDIKYDNAIFRILPNAKIITDVLYYVFENIYHLKDFSNHKIVTS